MAAISARSDLKGGNLSVDDQRSGKQWTFTNIDLSVTRPKGGGIALTVGSEAAERPWMMRATMTPAQQGRRVIDIETQKVPAKDLMLAMRLGEGDYEPDLPLSGRLRARHRARRQAADDRWPDRSRKGIHHRPRRSARAHSDRSRRNQSGLGCDAPSVGHAVPGRVGRKSDHVACPVRGAARDPAALGSSKSRAGRWCLPPRPRPIPAR